MTRPDDQVAFGTYVSEKLRHRFHVLALSHRLNMKEMLEAATDFIERYASEHPEFDFASYRQKRTRPKRFVPDEP